MFREKITTNFGSAGEWNKELDKFGKETTSIYARYEYPELAKREKEFAEMMGVSDTALFNAGMGAIYTTIEAEGLQQGDTVLCGKDVYSLTKQMYESLERRGIKIELCDSGNMDEIEQMVKEKKPRLIILESVANTQDMRVCDIKKLSEIAEEANSEYKENLGAKNLLDKYFIKRSEIFDEVGNGTKNKILENIEEYKKSGNHLIFRDSIRGLENETGLNRQEAVKELARLVKYIVGNSREKLSLIIDNTLASPALYNPTVDLKENGAEAIIVESGTKHYQEGKDRITLGIAYSNQEEKIKAIKAKRMELGTYLQPNDEKEIPEDIISAMPEIMKRHARNALKLAELISSSGKAIEVNHPNLPNRDQSDLVNEVAPEGISTLFYLKMANAEDFINKVKELGGDKIGIGGSFGHPKTWLFNMGEEIRIAAGSETEEEFEKVLDIFKSALEAHN